MKPTPSSSHTANLPSRAALLLAALTSCLSAAVPSSEVTPQSVVTDNLPVFTTLCGYEIHETSSTDWTNKEVPLYYPYNFDQPAMWDNIVAEILQARLPAIMCATRGAWTTNSADLEGPGNMNPRNLRKLVQAIQRANAANTLKIICFVDSPAMRGIYTQYYGYPSTTLFDIGNTAAWEDIVWQRTVKPWFDSVPSTHWYRINNRPVIQWWGFHPSWATNHAGNAGPMFQYISDAFFAAYGVRPRFILPSDLETSSNQDPGGAKNQPDVLGLNPWFGTPNEPARYLAHNGFVTGTVVPGFIDPGFFNPASSNYQNYNRVIFRNKIDGTGVNGDTLKIAMAAGVSANSKLTVLEGWTDQAEWAGYYRSLDDKWTTPNQYIDIVRSYSDLRTVTLKLEAEGADSYSDTTAENSGGSFLRAGEALDVRALTGTPVVSASGENAPWEFATHAADGKLGSKWYTPTPAPGWLQFDAGVRNASVVTGYFLTSSDFVQQRDPKDWQFQGSNDGTNWTTLDTRTAQVFTDRKQTNTYTFVNTTAYRYYRLNVIATYGGGSYGIALAEMTLAPVTNSTGGGWAVTNTASGEWIQFDNFTFSPGNYRFAIRYATTTANRRVRLHVDGVPQSIITLPVTANMDTFDTINVGQRTFTTGTHTLRIEFLDGEVDLDWLFAKKADQMLSLRAGNKFYVCAESGGNNIVIANRSAIGAWEKFSANDHNGGTLNHNEEISLQTWNGLLLCAELGGGGNLVANRRALGAWEKFTIVKTAGTGAIVNGDTVALRSSSGNYLTVGAGGKLDVTGTTIEPAQTFTASFNNQ
jgi:Domain of unknown function (DUF5010)/Carbohydrate binding module (family 35)/NedA-like, galactose-binding domain